MKIKNISKGVYKYQNLYVWDAGETLDVPDEVAAHVLEAQAGRFEVTEDAPSVKKAPNRLQRAGITRSR